MRVTGETLMTKLEKLSYLAAQVALVVSTFAITLLIMRANMVGFTYEEGIRVATKDIVRLEGYIEKRQ